MHIVLRGYLSYDSNPTPPMQLCFLWVGMLAAKFNFQLSAHFHPAGHHRIISCFCTRAERDRKNREKTARYGTRVRRISTEAVLSNTVQFGCPL
jgi:hypothetical protein